MTKEMWYRDNFLIKFFTLLFGHVIIDKLNFNYIFKLSVIDKIDLCFEKNKNDLCTKCFL